MMNVYGELSGELTGAKNLSGTMTGQKGIHGNLSSAVSGGVKDVEVNGESVVDEQGVAKVTIPPIPTKVSELENDEGFITAEDIPPLVTDLGYIDPEQYEDDLMVFMNTLTENGFYYFTFGGDDFSYIVQVESIDYDGVLLVNQHYWGDEEGPISEYIRAIAIEEGEVIEESTTAYMTVEDASNIFASKSHVHFRTASAALSVWDYCNGNQITFTTDSPIMYTDTRTPRHAWLIETTATLTSPNRRFIRLTDLQDASVIYQRSGTYSNGVITWGSWYKFTGTVFTP